MSLRLRLILVVVLAALALGAAGSAIVHLLASSERARVAQGESSIVDAVESFDGAIAQSQIPADSLDEARLRELGRASLAAVPDSSLGVCLAGGRIAGQVDRGPRGELQPDPHPLPPDQRDAQAVACRSAIPGTTSVIPVVHPHDTVILVTRGLGQGAAIWGLIRVGHPPGDIDTRWKIDVGLLSIATLLLIAVAASVLTGLARGVRGLEVSLGKLEGDLRAPIGQPSTAEFARLTNGLRGMAARLSEAREREEELLKSLGHRDRLSALGRVVAGAAHEIRNPLAGIKLKLDVLERAPASTPEVKAAARTCLAEIARLDRVVQSLLLVSRRSESTLATVALGDLVDERAHLASSGKTSPSAPIERTGAAEVVADRDELARAVDNLLRNALDASPAEQPVRVNIEENEDGVELSVVDGGPGIATDRLHELFEPFFTTKPGGTGLGLWLSRSLIEARGGSLVYERRDDETHFKLLLPRKASA